MIEVCGFSGFATTGKDAAVSFLKEFGYERVSFADAVREAALAIDPMVPALLNEYGDVDWSNCRRLSEEVAEFGWDDAKKNPEVRRLLQKIGTEAGRDIHGPDCWANIAADKANAILEKGGKVAFSDVRFESELDVIRRIAGCHGIRRKIIRIERPGVGPVNNHVSDNLDFPVDAVIQNDSDLETFRKRVLEAVSG